MVPRIVPPLLVVKVVVMFCVTCFLLGFGSVSSNSTNFTAVITDDIRCGENFVVIFWGGLLLIL